MSKIPKFQVSQKVYLKTDIIAASYKLNINAEGIIQGVSTNAVKVLYSVLFTDSDLVLLINECYLNNEKIEIATETIDVKVENLISVITRQESKIKGLQAQLKNYEDILNQIAKLSNPWS